MTQLRLLYGYPVLQSAFLILWSSTGKICLLAPIKQVAMFWKDDRNYQSATVAQMTRSMPFCHELCINGQTRPVKKTKKTWRAKRLHSSMINYFFFFFFQHDDVIKWKHLPRYWSFVRGKSRVTGEFPTQIPVTQSFDFFWYAPE